MSFAAALIARIADAGRTDALTVEERAGIDAALARSQEEWRHIDVSADAFASWIAARLPDATPIAAAFASLRVEDLYIACACAGGDPRAIAVFEQRYFAEVFHATRRATRLRSSDEDVAQMVRERIFVAREGMVPRIAEYRGVGSVRSWLRIVASRVVLSLVAKPERDTPTEAEVLADIATGEGDIELEHLKRVYRQDFRASVAEALVALDPKDRNVLSYTFAQGLDIDRVGAIYGVHRATAARWIHKARTALVEETRRALMARLGATDAEIDSIVKMIQSRFDLTLGGLLREGDLP